MPPCYSFVDESFPPLSSREDTIIERIIRIAGTDD